MLSTESSRVGRANHLTWKHGFNFILWSTAGQMNPYSLLAVFVGG